MKLKCFLFFSFFFFLNLAQAQSSRYQLQFSETSLENIFKYLESKHDLLFSFKLEDVKNVRRTIDIETEQLDLLMKQLLQSTPLDYEIVDTRYVLIKTKTAQKKLTEKDQPLIHLCGKVIDALTNEKLPYANVLIDGTSIGVSTSGEGEFTLSHAFKENQMIVISYVGYQKKSIPWQRLKSKNCLNVLLKYESFGNDFIVVTDYISDGIDLDENGAATKLDPKRLGNFPGQVEPNVLEVAQFMPGISSPGGKAADIYIRGCTPDQNLIIWEDIPIYHTAHYFGMISAFNPFIIEEMKVYRGGFGAEYGGRIAGVIDLKSGDENSKKTYIGAGTNMTHAYLYGHQRLPTKRSSAISFSFRRSFSELFRTPTFNNITKVNQQGLLLGSVELDALPNHIKVEDDFNFTDTHLKYSTKMSDRDRLSIAGLYTRNNFVDEIIDGKKEEFQRDSMNLENIGLSINWERQWNTKIQTKVTAVKNLYDYSYRYQLNEFNQSDSKLSGKKANKIDDTQLHMSTKIKNDRQQIFEVGYQLVNYDIEYQIQELSNRSKNINDEEQASCALNTLYIGFKNPIRNKLGVNVGLRSSLFGAANRIFLEPRIKLAYQAKKFLSLHANYGRYHQFISQISVFRGNNNGISSSVWSTADQPGIPVIKSDLYQVGLVFKQKGWVIDLQAYHRTINGISSRAADLELVDDAKTIIGSANIKGIDLLVKKRLGKVHSWISYSLSKAEFTFPGFIENSFLADYDQRHILQWNNQLKLNHFEFALGFKFSTGVPYSVISSFEEIPSSPNTPTNYQTFYDGIHSNILPSQHETNLSILYHLQPKSTKKWNGFLSFSITNLFNVKNVNNRTYYLETPKDRDPRIEYLDKSNLKFTPNLSLRIEW